MFNEWMTEIMENDLNKLKTEINLYKDETDLWKVKGEILNSAGNLCMHLLGNLNHFIGHIIGNTDYTRKRDLEFSDKNVSRSKLNEMIDSTIKVIKQSLPELKDSDIDKDFPVQIGGKTRKSGYLVIYLSDHFNYHLGQINYHRRLITEK
jgi:Protein of unknown function (DUF1572)